MHDFYCTDADDMHFKQLADRVRYFKENEEGVKRMCATLEKMRDETAKKAVDQTRVQIAVNLLKEGNLSIDQIARCSMLAVDRVKELASLQPV